MKYRVRRKTCSPMNGHDGVAHIIGGRSLASLSNVLFCVCSEPVPHDSVALLEGCLGELLLHPVQLPSHLVALV
eukprot:COSAG01_NODE_30258_length_619_cov_1.517308_1_plen_73_part_10